MKRSQRIITGAVLVAGLTAAFGMLHHHMDPDVTRPAPEEFGMGPRRSATDAWIATIEADQPLRVSRMQSVRLRLTNGSNEPVNGAAISVDGGMPEHRHGLPTRPRVTRELGNGAYLVEGVRFNMGGWWELRFHVTTDAGTDSVTFNLMLGNTRAEVPARQMELDRRQRLSHDERFHVTVLEADRAWTIAVATADGAPVEGASIEADAWMPESERVMSHRPPAVALGNGRYRIEALDFDSAGWWNVRMSVKAAGVTDSLAFNVIL